MTTRAHERSGVMNHTAKRNLMVGILGTALLFGLAAGTTARQDGEVAHAPGETVAAAAAPAVLDIQYRLSPPNELDQEDSARSIPVTGVPYRLSAPNERDPSGEAAYDSARADQPSYRVSPPNETNPTGP